VAKICRQKEPCLSCSFFSSHLVFFFFFSSCRNCHQNHCVRSILLLVLLYAKRIIVILLVGIVFIRVASHLLHPFLYYLYQAFKKNKIGFLKYPT
jgi:hypothetical protein